MQLMAPLGKIAGTAEIPTFKVRAHPGPPACTGFALANQQATLSPEPISARRESRRTAPCDWFGDGGRGLSGGAEEPISARPKRRERRRPPAPVTESAGGGRGLSQVWLGGASPPPRPQHTKGRAPPLPVGMATWLSWGKHACVMLPGRN